jgi:hypothetical protein
VGEDQERGVRNSGVVDMVLYAATADLVAPYWLVSWFQRVEEGDRGGWAYEEFLCNSFQHFRVAFWGFAVFGCKMHFESSFLECCIWNCGF